ncbi:LSU ribosomal protein L10P [Acidilobus saccharovorans 345-15]|uniref:Large ribosomal subunit protein uL10 n=1 Tax=Acidilobus saccharovorans (strain DSM 16705 / JCM 18335 / VKM B-2471 / 345-15) TaxID=666510 RepID=D9Q017_ACIS3|nr:50S ribosomal protein L10 [Acidilobus saccharovorans]ADL18655.1 LSU ribosomal protein L10P [Acidilobus saccharovorans 345-15]
MAIMIQKKGRPEPPEYKKQRVAELEKIFAENKYVLFADLEGLPAKQLQMIRKELRGKAIMTVAKKNLVYLALERRGLKKEKIEPYLKHGVLVIATNENPFLLTLTIDKLKMPAPAKPGQVATKDIVVPEGDTGIRPGPMVSVFGKLKIPYEVRKGTIYIKSDTVVAKKGDVISPDLASLLQQLGIQPMEIGLDIVAAWDGETVIPGDVLHIDLEATKNDIIRSEQESTYLAKTIGFFEVPEVVQMLAVETELEALSVIRAGELALDADTAKAAIEQAVAEETSIIAALGDKAKELGLEVVQAAPAAAPAQAPAQQGGEQKKEEEKKSEASEADISAGLSGLFGS